MRKSRSPIHSLLSCVGFGTPLTARFAEGDAPGGETPNNSSTGGGTNTVSLTRAEYDQLREAQTKLKAVEPELNTYKGRWDNTTKMLRGDLPPEERSSSLRTVLKDAGYSETDIEAYLSSGKESAPKNNRRTAEEDEPEGEDPRDLKIKELEQVSTQTFEQLKQMRLRELNTEMSREAMTVIGSPETKLGQVMSKMKELAKELEGDEASQFAETMGGIKEELNQLVTHQLRLRKEATGRFDQSWIAEETKSASEKLAKKYRPLVISLPNKIGRGGETDGVNDFVLPDKPVATPAYKQGMSREEAETKVEAWATDALLRAMKGTGSGKSFV